MKVAVLGAGVMGASIAGHLANAGFSILLLDQVPPSNPTIKSERDRRAQEGIDRLLRITPLPLYHPDVIQRMEIGNIEDDLDRLREVNWMIEAVDEKMSVKQQLLKKIERVWTKGTIVSSNTSSLSIQEMVRDCSEAFRAHFMGTHFFNPPRYTRLVEIIPTPDTDSTVLKQVIQWFEEQLGKEVIVGNDTPLFIANRLGIYSIQIAMEAMERWGMAADDVDAITGKMLGRSRSAMFHTLDWIGLDTYRQIVRNATERFQDPVEKKIFRFPQWLQPLIENRWLGRKTGQGLYSLKGKKLFVYDPAIQAYRPVRKLNALSLKRAEKKKDLSERLRTLLSSEDQVGAFAWYITKKLLLYAAEHVTEMANDLNQVDRAMKGGFHWQIGPFELWDTIGVARSVQRMRQEGETIPAWIETFLKQGNRAFYPTSNRRSQFDVNCQIYTEIKHHPKVIHLKQCKVIRSNQSASLVDLGDGIACLAFRSPNNAIDQAMIAMMNEAVNEVERQYEGLVIGNQNRHFCVGANLRFVLQKVSDRDWKGIDQMVRHLQQAIMALRALEKPVVAAPFGKTLGGGVELCFPADVVQASAESYMGLVETVVGLIPAGGGTTELLSRWTDGTTPDQSPNLQRQTKHAFEIIRQGKISTSARDAQTLKLLRKNDGITLHPDFLLFEAKQQALHLAKQKVHRSTSDKIPVLGKKGYQVLKASIYEQVLKGYISAYDYHIASKLAYVISGGKVPKPTWMDRQQLYDLEREACLSLIGEAKTQARMEYMLTKKRPLQN